LARGQIGRLLFAFDGSFPASAKRLFGRRRFPS
jgi:hypothetical protein